MQDTERSQLRAKLLASYLQRQACASGAVSSSGPHGSVPTRTTPSSKTTKSSLPVDASATLLPTVLVPFPWVSGLVDSKKHHHLTHGIGRVCESLKAPGDLARRALRRARVVQEERRARRNSSGVPGPTTALGGYNSVFGVQERSCPPGVFMCGAMPAAPPETSTTTNRSPAFLSNLGKCTLEKFEVVRRVSSGSSIDGAVLVKIRSSKYGNDVSASVRLPLIGSLITYRGKFTNSTTNSFGQTWTIQEVQPVPLVITGHTFAHFADIVASRAATHLASINEALISRFGKQAVQGIIAAACDGCAFDIHAFKQTPGHDEQRSTSTPDNNQDAAGQTTLLISKNTIRNWLHASPFWTTHRHLLMNGNHRVGASTARVQDPSRSLRLSDTFDLVRYFRMTPLGTYLLDADWLAHFLVASFHPDLLKLFPISTLETMTFDMRGQVDHLRTTVPFALFFDGASVQCMIGRWRQEVARQGSPVNKDSGDTLTPFQVPPEHTPSLLALPFAIQETARGRAATPSRLPSLAHLIMTPRDCMLPSSEVNVLLEKLMADTVLVNTMIDTHRPSVGLVNMLENFANDDEAALALRVLLSPEQYTIVWLMALLVSDENTSKNTAFTLTRVNQQSVADGAIEAVRRGQPVPAQELCIEWNSYDRWRVGRPDNPAFAHVRRLNWYNTLCERHFLKAYNLKLPGALPSHHHNVLVGAARLGVFHVRSFLCGVGVNRNFIGFRTRRWQDAADTVRMVEFILLRNLLNQQEDLDTIACLGKADRDETPEELRGRTHDAVSNAETLLSSSNLDAVGLEKALVSVRNTRQRIGLDGSQMVSLMLLVSMPGVIITGHAGSGKTTVLNHLHAKRELIVPKESGGKELVQAINTCVQVPTCMLRSRIDSFMPVVTSQHMRTYAFHYNQAKLDKGTMSSDRPTIEQLQSSVITSIGDEVYMLGIEAAKSMLAQMLPAQSMSNLGLCADTAQLAPVACGGILRELVNHFPELSVVTCDQNHRTEAARVLTEVGLAMAKIGDAFEPSRVSRPRLCDPEAYQRLIDKFAAGQLYDPIAKQRIQGDHQPWGTGATERLRANLLVLRKRLKSIEAFVASTPDRQAALAAPVIMHPREARAKANELAKLLVQAGQPSTTGKRKKPEISLRWFDEVTDIKALATAQEKTPNDVQMLCKLKKTNQRINEKIAEVQGWKIAGRSMPSFFAPGMKLYASDKLTLGAIVISRNQSMRVIQVYMCDADLDSAQARWAIPLPSSVPGIQFVHQTSDTRNLPIDGDVTATLGGQTGGSSSSSSSSSSTRGEKKNQGLREMMVVALLNEYGALEQRYLHMPVTKEVAGLLAHGSSRTVHTSQGTDVREVYAGIGSQTNNPEMYTATTRAENSVKLFLIRSALYPKHKGWSLEEGFVHVATTVPPPRMTSFGWLAANRDRLGDEPVPNTHTEEDTLVANNESPSWTPTLEDQRFLKQLCHVIHTRAVQETVLYTQATAQFDLTVRRRARDEAQRKWAKRTTASGGEGSSVGIRQTLGDVIDAHTPLPAPVPPKVPLAEIALSLCDRARVTHPWFTYHVNIASVVSTHQLPVAALGGHRLPPDSHGIAVPRNAITGQDCAWPAVVAVWKGGCEKDHGHGGGEGNGSMKRMGSTHEQHLTKRQRLDAAYSRNNVLTRDTLPGKTNQHQPSILPPSPPLPHSYRGPSTSNPRSFGASFREAQQRHRME